MSDIKAFVQKFDDDEKHMVMRLGAAVLKQWANLPEDVQRRLLDQANFAEDPKHLTVQVREQLNVLVRKHNPGWGEPNA